MMMTTMLESAAGSAVRMAAWIITGVRAFYTEPQENLARADGPCVYFANHRSTMDSVLIWTALPKAERDRARFVAAAEYWTQNPLRRFFGVNVFRAILVERNVAERTRDPVADMIAGLDEGAALIIFPEGTRNTGEETLLPFKTGIFHVAEARPQTRFVPVWIDNLARVLPKGEVIPIPLLCTVTFGAAMTRHSGETKEAFLARARTAMLDLAAKREADA